MPWSHRLTHFDGRPAQVLIDERFRESAPLRKLSRLAWFAVYARNDPGPAFWDPNETAVLDAIEGDLIRLCDQFGRGYVVYVLRIVTRGIREYFLYFGGSAALSAVLPALRAAYPDYRIEFDQTSDASWRRYISCLPGMESGASPTLQ
jgi:hypothetical protein